MNTLSLPPPETIPKLKASLTFFFFFLAFLSLKVKRNMKKTEVGAKA